MSAIKNIKSIFGRLMGKNIALELKLKEVSKERDEYKIIAEYCCKPAMRHLVKLEKKMYAYEKVLEYETMLRYSETGWEWYLSKGNGRRYIEIDLSSEDWNFIGLQLNKEREGYGLYDDLEWRTDFRQSRDNWG